MGWSEAQRDAGSGEQGAEEVVGGGRRMGGAMFSLGGTSRL